MDKNTFLQQLTEKVNTFWQSKEEPLLLSSFPMFWKKDDYEGILDGKTLKQFLQASSEGCFRIIEHPTQKAKVGLIPFNENYVFSEEIASKDNAQQYNKEKILLAFLNSLKDLSDKELDSINIPLSVMVKLLK